MQLKQFTYERKNKYLAEGVAVADDIQVDALIEIQHAACWVNLQKSRLHPGNFKTTIQYSMAADRMNEQVSYLYQPYNPSIFSDQQRYQAAHEGKWAGMCEWLGEPKALSEWTG